MKISKLDAAKRQLETAIALYFHQADPVSVHTLTAAAYAVLRDLNSAVDGSAMIKDWARTYVKEDCKKELRRKLNEAENYFKHADRDRDDVLDFEPGQSELLLLDACWTYKRLSGERPPLLGVFETWAWGTFASDFVSYEGQDLLVQSGNDVFKKDRKAF